MRRPTVPRARGVRRWLRVVLGNPRTTTVATWRGGALTLPCPDWCTGHPHGDREEHPSDFAHEGPEHGLDVVTAKGGTDEILAVSLAWLPLSTDDVHLRMTVDLGAGGWVQFTPAEVRTLADGLVEHAGFLREFADRYEVLRVETDEAMRPPGIPLWLPPLQGLDEVEEGWDR